MTTTARFLLDDHLVAEYSTPPCHCQHCDKPVIQRLWVRPLASGSVQYIPLCGECGDTAVLRDGLAPHDRMIPAESPRAYPSGDDEQQEQQEQQDEHDDDDEQHEPTTIADFIPLLWADALLHKLLHKAL